MEINQIYTGDARALSLALPDEIFGLAFPDPVYENVEDYEWLGKEAMRVLKPNSALLAWCKTTLHDECKAAIATSGLTYRYTLYYACSAKGSKPVDGGIFPWVTPCLFFSKGKVKAEPNITDWYFSATSAKSAFAWNKGSGVIEKWLASFSKRGDLVFDPFTGEGSVPQAAKRLGRDFIAFEIDADRAATARRRVERTIPMNAPVILPLTDRQMALA
jgi:DNA modification methylase